MSSILLTTRADYDAALAQLLPLARHSLRIFDRDLDALRLDRPERSEFLRHFLSNRNSNTLQIVLQNADALKRGQPRLMALMTQYSHQFQVIEAPPQLANLSDSMLLVDDCHALIRFHHDHARGKCLTDTAEECAPYLRHFAEILNEGGSAVGPTTLGL